MNKKIKSESELYDLSLSLLNKEDIDMSQLSEAEKSEIEQNMKLIQMIQGSEKSIMPRKASLSRTLNNLYQETEEESRDWSSFFSGLFTKKRALAYVLPALLVIAGINISSQSTFDVKAAQALTNEIQEDFLTLSKEMEEMEALNINLLSSDFDITTL